MTSPNLSVVIPAFNEEARIGGTLAAIAAYLDAQGEDYEAIVVDDGSTDGTSRVVEGLARTNPRIRLLALPENRGKGAAVRAGVMASAGEQVLFSDADLAAPIEELPKLRARLGDGCAIAIGSRAVPGADIRVRQQRFREYMGRTFNLLVRVLVMGGVRDTQCGFKLFDGRVARELFAASTIDGFAFDVEVLLLARPRYKIAEVPIAWRHVEQSKVSPGRDATRMLLDVVKLSWKRRRKS